MLIKQEQDIIDTLNGIKDQIESNLKVTTNEQLNDDFKRLLEDSSCDSSSSTLTSSSDDETAPHKPKTQKKLIKKIRELEDEDSDDDDTESSPKKPTNKPRYLKTKDEVSVDDLAPIEKLEISLEDDIKLSKLGKVISKVDDKLIVVQSLRVENDSNSAPLDEETYLFDSNRKPLGKIFETFGPVTNPFYSIRFNSLNEIKERELDLDLDSFVFYAQSTKFTKFVFNVDELRKQKGSDASWNNDNEPPVECVDYSDDEKEKLAKRQLKQARAKVAGGYANTDSGGDASDDNSIVTEKKPANNQNKKFMNRSFSSNNNTEGNQHGYKRKYQNSSFTETNSNTNTNTNSHFPRSKSYGQGSFQQNNNFNPQQQFMQGQNFYPQQQFWPQQPGNFMQMNQFNPNLNPNPYFQNQGFSNNNNNNNNNQNFAYQQQFPQQFPYQFNQQQYPQQQYQAQSFNNNFGSRNIIPQNNQQSQNSQNSSSSPAKTSGASVIDKRFIKNSSFVKKSF